MLLSNLSIKRPVFATVMMLALVALGITSYRRLAIDLWPDVEVPVISIVTIFPGASPATVEREVAKRIEEAVNPIAGVRHVNSISRESVAQLIVEFNLDTRLDQAVQEARTKIAAIRGDLPPAIQDPIIEKLDIVGGPVVSLAVRSTSLSPRDLTTLVDRKVKPRLENVAGVGKIDLVGTVKREVGVEIKPDRLEALGMGVDDVTRGLGAENIDTPLGRMTKSGHEIPLRVQGKAATVDDFSSMVIAYRSGRPVTLGEVAGIEDGVEEVRSLALVNGTPAVALDVLKQTGANAVGVADAITKEAASLERDLPSGTTVELVRDGSVFIRESVADVQNTLIIGSLLTVFIVFLFLNSWRSTIITGLTLPISVISSFIVMYFGGMTLNTMTLMGLSLAIGLLIDDAIVVRENIVRHLEHGEDHFEAARNGTSEIGLAVLATTFSIVAVFVPVAFMKGIIGRFFFAFGITVTFAVLVSLFVSFTLDPMLSSRWVDPDIARTGRRNPIARLLDRFNAWFDRTADRYRAVIGWALDYRWVVVGLAVAAFAGGIALMGRLESEFVPQPDEGEFVAVFTTAPDASIAETRDRLDAVLSTLGRVPGVERTYASIGAGDAGTVRDSRVYIKLAPREARSRTQKQIERDVRAQLAGIPGIVPSLLPASSMFARKPLQVEVHGEDIALLKDLSQQLKNELYRVRGIVDLEATLEHDTPEYRLIVDRERAGDLGVNSAVVAGTVATLVGGRAVTTFEDEDGESRHVRVRLPAGGRQDAAQLQALRLAVTKPFAAAPGPVLVPLASVARYELSTTPAEINRRDLSREVVVSANLDRLPLGTAVTQVARAAGTLTMPPGYRVVVGGEGEDMKESFGYMGEALVLSVLFVYLILAAQFESFVDPLAIMLSLPLSVVGMAGLLWATGDTINVMSLIGLIMLMGLVTKNAILLVDYAKVLRGRGMSRRDAVIEAGRTRLRPIVMTSAAMIFGMLPLAFAIGSGAEFRAPMARAVIGGLITSTILTLVVVPVVYTLLEDLAARLTRRRHAAVPAAATALTLAIALAFGAAGTASAQIPASDAPAVSETKTLTLDEALAIAGAQNRDVQKAVEYQKWVRAKYVEERAAALPQVTAAGSFLRQFDDTQSKLFRSVGPIGDSPLADVFGGRQDLRFAELRLTQPLFTWGQVGAAVRAARVGFGLADDQLRRFRQAVARDVSTAFYDVLVAKELAVIAEQDLAQKARHLEQARRLQAAGLATDYDVLAASVTVENARPAVIRGQNGVRLARAQLRFLLAEGAADVDASGTLATTIEPAPAFESVLTQALANRPELAELSNQRGILRELVNIASAGNKPRVDLAVSVGTRNLGVSDLSSSGSTWNAAVLATVPVFDGQRARGRVAQAESDLTRATIDDRKLRDAIALEVRTAVHAVEESTGVLAALDGTVRQAEQLVFLAEKGFELGVKTRLDVQDAELNLQAAHASRARAQRDYRVARVTLAWVSGTIGN
ncbi:MAG: efflux RND transporter permease subunit [Acidobacteriia bacterium]|nr:efflux RND transporter permease subunit [Terriglobia bacterium]